MTKNLTPLTLYRHLPKTNCGKCEQRTCMAFASSLIERKTRVEACPPLLETKHQKGKEALENLLRPPVREVRIGRGAKEVAIGGQEVVRRHELTYFNRTAIAIEVSDELAPDEIAKRAGDVSKIRFERVGDVLTMDLVAVRCASGDPAKFAHAAALSAGAGLPLILCSLCYEEMEAALKEVGAGRPLLYAASQDNWESMSSLAIRYGCPIVVSAAGTEALAALVSKVRGAGVRDIVLDPGTSPCSAGLGSVLHDFTKLRVGAIERGQEVAGYPLMGVPAVVWTDDGSEAEKSLEEAMLASCLITRYADLLVLKTMEPWAHLAVMTLRQNIYTDPRRPVAVEPGLKEYGSPDRSSPLLLTTNFALTFYTVESDIQSANVDCYLIVVDTEGIGVQSSVAGGQLDAKKVAEALDKCQIRDRIDHRTLIIPGMAARLKGDIEDATGFEVVVGPRDSSGIQAFLEKRSRESSRG